jgi:hypothetical protein
MPRRLTWKSRIVAVLRQVKLRLDGRRMPKDPNRAVARLLAELLESCSLSRSGFSGHDYVLLATCVVRAKKDAALVRFFEAIKDHQWAKLREFQSWLGKADNVEAYEIGCSEHVTVAVVKTYFEPLQGARLLYSEALSKEESVGLLQIFTNLEWHQF